MDTTFHVSAMLLASITVDETNAKERGKVLK